MADQPAQFPTSSDILGAVQRGLMELNGYLSQPADEINIDVAMKYLEGLGWRLSHLRAAQPASNGKASEARAN